MKLIALQEVWYAGRTRHPADPRTGRPADDFEASDQDAAILKGIGKAADAPAPQVAPRTTIVEKAVTEPSTPAEQTEKSESLFSQQADGEAPPKPGKRTYKRRDMVAED